MFIVKAFYDGKVWYQQTVSGRSLAYRVKQKFEQQLNCLKLVNMQQFAEQLMFEQAHAEKMKQIEVVIL